MEITVEIKTLYGIDRIYPVCPKAKLFADIAHTKTLSKHDIDKIKELGYSIIVQQETRVL